MVARPFGGVLADKFGPKIISLISLGGVVILAVITAFQPNAEHVYGAVFILMGALLGLGHGSVFGWLGRVADPKNVGAVSGDAAGRDRVPRLPVGIPRAARWQAGSR